MTKRLPTNHWFIERRTGRTCFEDVLDKLRSLKAANSAAAAACDPNIGDVDEEVRDSVI
jgi:hypothetical protein